jgi:hypothetical protein
LARKRHIVHSASPPLGGINVRDAINAMPATDALALVNWIPQQYGLRARKGYVEWCTGMVEPVRTVMQYQPDRENAGTYKLFGVTDDDVYDVTSSSATPSSVLTLPGTTDYGRFSHLGFANSAGTFLAMCSHKGGYHYYDGTAWATPTAGVGVGQVDGVDPADLVFIAQWKRRLWFVEQDSSKVWYADPDALTGTFAELDVGPFMKHGGKVAFIATWTIDAGEGIDDFLVIVGENGDVLVYKGTDPTAVATFALVGSWYVGNLVLGRRGLCQYGGDLLILSELGVQPLSFVTRGGQSILAASKTDYLGKIQPALAETVADGLSDNDWDMTLFPRDNLLIIQKPVNSVGVYDQYVLYTNTQKWTTFTGLPMISSVVANNKFYFGTEDGRVCEGFTGYFDAVLRGEDSGDPIRGSCQTSYSYFGLPGANKQFLMVRPSLLSPAQPGVLVNMLADFENPPALGTPVYEELMGATWDSALWDSATWVGASNVFADWYSVAAMGYVGSLLLTTTCIGDTFLTSIDYMFEVGGPL